MKNNIITLALVFVIGVSCGIILCENLDPDVALYEAIQTARTPRRVSVNYRLIEVQNAITKMQLDAEKHLTQDLIACNKAYIDLLIEQKLKKQH